MNAEQKALRLFRDNPILRTRDALNSGIHPRTLYALRDSGQIEALGRGLFALTDRAPMSQLDLVIVAGKITNAVIGFISGLAFHELTTQIPHAVHIALPASWNKPILDYPPLEIYRVSEPAYSAGVEQHTVDGVDIPIYDAEKCVADAFKFRNRIGKDVALASLKTYLERRSRNLDKLMDHAVTCRVAGRLQPYIEALA